MRDDGPTASSPPADTGGPSPDGDEKPGRNKPKPPSLSVILRDIAQPRNDGDDRIAVGTLVESFGQRAFGILLFIFAVPNAFPLAVPGFTVVMGIPVVLLLWQIMVGKEKPWLPKFLRDRSFSRSGFAKIVDRAVPVLEWMEKYSRPRLVWLYTRVPLAIVSAFMVLLAVVMAVPMPLTNVVPAIAISMWALGLVERDGIASIAGIVLGIVWLVVLYVLYFLAFHMLVFFTG